MAALKIGIKKSPKTEKKEYPTLNDPQGDLAFDVDELVSLTKEADTLYAKSKAIEKNLKERAIKQFFTQYSGKADVPSSMKVNGFSSKIMMSFTSRYKELDIEDKETYRECKALLNGSTKRILQEKFQIKVDGDRIPSASAQEICDALVELFQQYDCEDALSLKQTYAVNKAFHTERHTALTPLENERLQETLPFVTSVKKKGVV
tara:strand:+ start:184 stop:798 length:615 start_codon:yes stop_codon:yes gene_type:complete